MRALKAVVKFFGSGLRAGFALIGILAMGSALANYNMTIPGSGTSFASAVIGSVHYAQMLLCDATLGTAQCAAVDSSGNVAVKDAAVLAAVQAAIPAGTNLIGKVGIDQTTPGTTNAVSVQYGSTAAVPDACQVNTPLYANINYASSGLNTTPLIVGTSGKKIHFCHLDINNNAAESVAIFEATTGTSCGTGAAALWGGTTAAAGWNFSANGGISLGMGSSEINATATNNDDVCIITSTATQNTGRIKYVVQ